jgi:hypothetical protein
MRTDVKRVAQEASARLRQEFTSGVKDIRTSQGWAAVVGGIGLDIVARTLVLCPTDRVVSHPSKSISEVNPRFVLAQAWQLGRLSEACQRRTEGIQDDPIRVSGVGFPGVPIYYQVTDGMHRTVAARLAGDESIRAYVSEIGFVDPRRLGIVNRVPWHFDERWGWERSVFGREQAEVVDLLCSLGVECRETWPFWLKMRLFGQPRP